MSIAYSELANTRRRTIEANHERLIETQQLDALLRIEELMQKLVEAGGVRIDDEIQIEGDLTDILKDVKPVETPFQKAVAEKPKGSRGKVDRL